MSELDQQTPDISGKMHEFSFDVLVRIIPGTVVLASYFGENLKSLDASLLIGIGVVIAYVIGYGIEMITILADKCLITPILMAIEYVFSPKKEMYCRGHSLVPVPEFKMWQFEDKAGKKARFFKMIAERSMWRSLVLITAFYCFKPPKFLDLVSTQFGVDPLWLARGLLAVSILGFYNLSRFPSSMVRHGLTKAYEAKSRRNH